MLLDKVSNNKIIQDQTSYSIVVVCTNCFTCILVVTVNVSVIVVSKRVVVATWRIKHNLSRDIINEADSWIQSGAKRLKKETFLFIAFSLIVWWRIRLKTFRSSKLSPVDAIPCWQASPWYSASAPTDSPRHQMLRYKSWSHPDHHLSR